MGRPRSAECCPGEPHNGDPRGLHNHDCPEYLDNSAALAEIFGAGKRREPDPLGLRSERGRALAGPMLTGRPVRDATDAELRAEQTWLRERLAAVDGEISRRDGTGCNSRDPHPPGKANSIT